MCVFQYGLQLSSLVKTVANEITYVALYFWFPTAN
jgi:hypothetical protein